MLPLPEFDQPPRRVVSLVPSSTESLCELGLGGALAGVTDYCIHPADQTARLPKVGGTRNPRLADILALQPDLIIANQEENTRESVEVLRDAGIPLWLTFPRTVEAAIADLYTLAGIFRSQTAMLAVKSLAHAVDYARAAAPPRVRYFCPIWYDDAGWWMTFNRDTYCHDLLALLGGENIFADRKRRYPLEADIALGEPRPGAGRDTRYPRVTAAEIIAADPEIILLPSEPYEFTPAHSREAVRVLGATAAARAGRVQLVDGSLITWHGTRLARALRELGGVFGL
jgi:ABC-type Fe3+-hydroxamate transport system substrate-binding protein